MRTFHVILTGFLILVATALVAGLILLGFPLWIGVPLIVGFVTMLAGVLVALARARSREDRILDEIERDYRRDRCRGPRRWRRSPPVWRSTKTTWKGMGPYRTSEFPSPGE
jgi:protein-S-isoprenylcysteine O-methyltransferase Ste14